MTSSINLNNKKTENPFNTSMKNRKLTIYEYQFLSQFTTSIFTYRNKLDIIQICTNYLGGHKRKWKKKKDKNKFTLMEDVIYKLVGQSNYYDDFFSSSSIWSPAILPDLTNGSGEWTDISHLDHCSSKIRIESFRVTGICTDQRISGSSIE